jgi:hypothetical protein
VEKFNDRLMRLTFGDEHEFVSSMIGMLENSMFPEIAAAKSQNLIILGFLGTHAVMQMVGKTIYDREGPPATEFYLHEFVDGATADRRWSEISTQIHRMRNVMAHQGFSLHVESVILDDRIAEGFVREPAAVRMNPRLYIGDFVANPERLATYEKLVSEFDLLKQKYRFLAAWLALKKGDALLSQLTTLANSPTLHALRTDEPRAHDSIRRRYNL